MTNITVNLQTVRDRVAVTARRSGREPDRIRILAVSKTHDIQAVREAVQAGQKDFGENYLQDALPKIASLAGLGLTWHFIGRLQSNKTRPVAEAFDWVQTVDRTRIARRLNDQRPAEAPPMNVCIQVHLGEEASKGGIPPCEVEELASAIVALPRLSLRGLMCLPPPTETETEQRYYFRQLRKLFEELGRKGFQLDTLSMGMSGDLEAAIMEGATMLRIGTAIFGLRKRPRRG